MQTDELFATTARATFSYHGIPVELDLLQMDAGTLEAIEKRIDRLLQRPGWSAPQQATAAPAGGNGSRKLKVQPAYDDQGYACCPTHGRRLSEGKYGLYCPAKAADGEPANSRGYCDLRFIDPEV